MVNEEEYVKFCIITNEHSGCCDVRLSLSNTEIKKMWFSFRSLESQMM